MRSSLLFAISLMVLACGGGDSSVTPPPPPAAVPTTVQITPAAPSLEIGQALQLAATVLDDRGQTMAGQSITWSTSDVARVTVNQSGLATGVSLGSAVITARTGNIQASVTANVVRPVLSFDEGASVSKVVGPTGGSITAQGANGTTYRLDIPRRALDDSVNITLTPVTSLGATPLHGAVRMRPSGLRFTLPVTVTVELPSAPANANDVVGFHFSDDGQTLSRYPVAVVGKQLQFLVAHFSGVGGAGPALTPALSTTPGGSAVDQILSTIIAQVNSNDLTGLIASFRTWYSSVVKPRLSVANSDSAAKEAIAAWSFWLGGLSSPVLNQFSGQLITALASEITEARNLGATAIQLAIIRANSACIQGNDLLVASGVFKWQEIAETMSIATVQFGLDAQSVLNTFCAQVRYVAVTLPDTLRPGRAATLRVQAGLSFGGGPLNFRATALGDLQVTATPTASTDDTPRKALTDGIGVATFQVAPADTTPMSIAVKSCLNPDIGLALGTPLMDKVCADTTVGKTATNVLYFRDFAAGAPGPEWSTTQVTTSPSGQRFLGELGNTSTTLSLNSLPAHTQLVLEFDIYIIDSWNGNGGIGSAAAPDIVEVSVVGGAVLKKTTFSNKPSDVQAFPQDYPGGVNPAGTGSLSKGALGYPPDPDHFGDSVYRIRLTFNHTSGIIALKFASQQTSGQNERWGIDNVRLSLTP
jgi:hypothetical protein